MKLVAGLGNPGEKYRGTRHNVGFEVVDLLATRHNVSFNMGPGETLLGRWRRGAEIVVLLKPLTFMNLSGQAVADAGRYYKVDVADVLIVCDDVNLPSGRLRARASGSDGGHNGLKSIAQQLGTAGYGRLRLGVGRGDARRDLADHVLSKFEAGERPVIESMVARAADAVETWVADGVASMMNIFNRSEDRSEEQP